MQVTLMLCGVHVQARDSCVVAASGDGTISITDLRTLKVPAISACACAWACACHVCVAMTQACPRSLCAALWIRVCPEAPSFLLHI
jgi:hypothetical protein